MKLNYKIIWVEDKIETKPFESIKNNIESFLTDKFFNVDIYTAEDFDEFKEIFEANGSFDLVITDYSLNDSHGNEVIDFIRMDKNILTEVFFYSANTQLRTVGLANSSRISFYTLEGTGYHAELQRKIEELIALTIAKFEHIVSMRGMIMHEASSLDEQTFEMVVKYVTNTDDDIRTKLYDELISFFERKFNDSSKFKKNNNINSVIKDPLLLSSAQRANVLSTIIDKKGFDNFIGDFKKDVISIRNQFAHAVLAVNEDGREYFKNKSGDRDFNSEFCKEIRQNIIKHKKNLDDLEVKINE
jgi:CheY-like chemotaxis protein